MVRELRRKEFEGLFRSTYPAVLRSTYLILNDRGRAEEVTQDSFLRLYERWRGVNEVEHPGAWVRQVAVRSAVRDATRRRLRSASLADHAQAAWDRLPDVDLAHAVASLPPQQRAAVVLFYLEDMTVNDVAALLDVSTSTVKQHLHRARARLAKLLAEPEAVAHDVD